MIEELQAPFPYFGGKSAVADVVWERFGNVKHYIEPFFGSGAVLLQRPDYDPTVHVETINDADGHVANAWRAMQSDPDGVAKICDWPVNHADLCARRKVLQDVGPQLLERLQADPAYFDATLAGYWIWGMCSWIGAGLTRINARPNLGDAGKGVHAISRRPHLGDAGRGVQELYVPAIYDWFRDLSERLRHVRVVCGDWSRVCGGDWQDNLGICGYFFDPPYTHSMGRDPNCYETDHPTVAQDVATWALDRGSRETYRIAICGYEGEHPRLESAGWDIFSWKAQGGMASLGKGNGTRGEINAHRERIWFSPHCVKPKKERTIFDFIAECK